MIGPPASTAAARRGSDPVVDTARLRTLSLGTRMLAYRLKRSARRTIGFSIDRSGLTVSAPARLPLGAIEAAIADKQRWIFAKLAEWVDRPETLPTAPADWQDGDVFPLAGEPHVLRIGTAHERRGRIDFDPLARVLTLSLPPDAGAEQTRMLLQRWLREEARRCFAERLALHAPRLGVSFNAFGLSSATTRWGSCSSRGTIRLNWRLLHFPIEVIDYVVIHELAHLREMNHSPRFWAIVAGAMPDYKAARAALKSGAPAY